ncbi:hypothetical protein ACR3K2_07820 [Cryptosporidium serpentis]
MIGVNSSISTSVASFSRDLSSLPGTSFISAKAGSPQKSPNNLYGVIQAPRATSIRVMLPVRDIGDLTIVTYEHQAFVGCGGSLRFFLLGKQVKHKFINVPVDKDNPIPEYIESSKVPLGELPIIKLGDLVIFDEIPCLRFLAKKLGEYGRNYYIDFVIDDVVMRCNRWRDILMDLILSSNNCVLAASTNLDKSEGPYSLNNAENSGGSAISSLEGYKQLREQLYTEFEVLITSIGEKEGSYIADKDKPMICDFALFSVLFDDISLSDISPDSMFQRIELLPDNCLIHQFPRLKSLFLAMSELPLVNQWIKGKYFIQSNIDKTVNKNFSENAAPPTFPLQSPIVGNQQPSHSLYSLGAGNGVASPGAFSIYQPCHPLNPPISRFQYPMIPYMSNQGLIQASAGVRFAFPGAGLPINNQQIPMLQANSSFISPHFAPQLNPGLIHPFPIYQTNLGSPCNRMSPSQSFT